MFWSLALAYRVGESTLRGIVYETCQIIYQVLSPVYLKTPNEQEWLKIAKGFERVWHMPNCVGSIDGKHVNIQAPKNSGSTFFNYQKTFSIVLMAACDYRYKFTCVEVGAYGSECDGSILQNS